MRIEMQKLEKRNTYTPLGASEKDYNSVKADSSPTKQVLEG